MQIVQPHKFLFCIALRLGSQKDLCQKKSYKDNKNICKSVIIETYIEVLY